MLSLPVANSSLGLGEFDYGTQPIPHARISALSMEHDDLGLAIDALVGANTHDELMIARLKKRRLQIRDEIAGLVAGLMGGKSDAAMFRSDADNDADMDASEPHVIRVAAAPSSGGGAFLLGVFATVLIVLGLAWGGMADSVNQTLAQIYVLSLLAAANG